MKRQVPPSTAVAWFLVYAYNSSTGANVTGISSASAGLTVVLTATDQSQVSYSGANLESLSGTVANPTAPTTGKCGVGEIGNGQYIFTVNYAQSKTNAAGKAKLSISDTAGNFYAVEAIDTTTMPSTDGAGNTLLSVGTGTGQINPSGGAVALQADQAVNVTKWGGTAVGSTSVSANVEQWNGSDVVNLPANYDDLAIENTTGRVQIQVGTGDGKLATSNGQVDLKPNQSQVTVLGGLTVSGATIAASGDWLTSLGTNAPADWLNAAAVKADAVTKIQNGLSTLTQTQVSGGAYDLTNATYVAALKSALGKVPATLASGDVTGNLPADVKAYTVQPTVSIAAADIRSAVGMAAADLDVQLDAIASAGGSLTVAQAAQLTAIETQANKITTDNVTTVDRYDVNSGNITIVRGESLQSSNGTQLTITEPSGSGWPTNLTGYTLTFTADKKAAITTGDDTLTATTVSVSPATGTGRVLTLQLTSAQTDSLGVNSAGVLAYDYDITATLSGGLRTVLRRGQLSVLPERMAV